MIHSRQYDDPAGLGECALRWSSLSYFNSVSNPQNMITDVAHVVLSMAAHAASTVDESVHILLVLPHDQVPDVLRVVMAVRTAELVLAAPPHVLRTSSCPRFDIHKNFESIIGACVRGGNVHELAELLPFTNHSLFWAGQIAFGAAAEYGDLGALEWLWEYSAPEKGIYLPELVALVPVRASGIAVLDWLWNKHPGLLMAPSQYSDVLVAAASAGQLAILQWWYAKLPERWTLANTRSAMHAASMAFQMHAREWMEERCHIDSNEYDYMEEMRKCLAPIATHNRVDLLAWWHDRLPEFKIRQFPLQKVLATACRSGSLDVLEWFWLHSHQNIALANSDRFLDLPSIEAVWCRSQFPVFQWACARNLLAIVHSLTVLQPIVLAGAAQDMRTLEWWWTQAQLPKIPVQWIVQAACVHGRTDVLDAWWEKLLGSDNQFVYDKAALTLASGAGHISVLAWFWAMREELPFTFSGRAFDQAALNKQVVALEWWRAWCAASNTNNGAFALTAASLLALTKANDTLMLEWWYRHIGSTGDHASWITDRVLGPCLGAAVAHVHVSAFQFWTRILGTTQHGRLEVVSYQELKAVSAANAERAADLLIVLHRSYGLKVQDPLPDRLQQRCCSFMAKLQQAPQLAAGLDAYQSGVSEYHSYCHQK
ncbi:hypothetical protein BC828DRAFT_376133 [Blastocladiella britannica]|nr:hypothetical protein BC828DRAFT_376133 [Blastocladiella britannica]